MSQEKLDKTEITQKKLAKDFEKMIALGIIVPAVFSLGACAKPPAIEVNQETNVSKETTPPITAAETALPTTAIETIVPTATPETTAEKQDINILKTSFLVSQSVPQEQETNNQKENKEEVQEAIVIRSGPNKSEVYLTFDDCWSESAVKEILQIAKENEIKVTFFPTGQIIKKFPELWQQVIAEGNEIGNHTYSHPDLRKLSEEKIIEQLQKTQDALDKALGYYYPMKFLRPPGGGFNKKVKEAVFAYGIQYLAMWAVDDGAITTFKENPERILPHLENSTDGGEIVLFHVSNPEIKILPSFIEYLKKKDLTMVTMTELLTPPLLNSIPLS